MLLLILVLLLLFGFGGYRLGGPDYGPHGGLGAVLIVLLIVYLLGGFAGDGLRLPR